MRDINIVLLNYFCKDDILAAVASVRADVAGSPYDIQITVADNSENKDDLREALYQQFPEVKYINSGGNVGFGQGNTNGFKAAPARYYFALNRDIIVPRSTKVIERLVKFMDEHPKIACVGPKLVNMDGTLQFSCYRFDLPSLLIKSLKQINWDKKYRWVEQYTNQLLMKDFDHNETRPVDWVLGAALLVRQAVVSQLGWFDKRYFMYLEDCDWCRTMWERGWTVYYVHDIVIQHRYARESAKVPGIVKALFRNKLARIHLISWLKFLWKWRGQHRYYSQS